MVRTGLRFGGLVRVHCLGEGLFSFQLMSLELLEEFQKCLGFVIPVLKMSRRREDAGLGWVQSCRIGRKVQGILGLEKAQKTQILSVPEKSGVGNKIETLSSIF